MLVQTFAGLAAGDSRMLAWLMVTAKQFKGIKEADLCDALVTLICENPQYPPTGDALLWAICRQYHIKGHETALDITRLETELWDRISELKQLRADIAADPSIQQFLAESAAAKTPQGRAHRDQLVACGAD